MEVKPTKDFLDGQENRDALLRGVTKVYKAVSTTLGSRGRNVLLEKNWGEPLIVHDGVTVAKHVVLPEPFENQAAQLVIRAAQKTNDQAGDGTTTATVLTYAIFKEAHKAISSSDVNPMVLREGLVAAKEAIITSLKAQATPVESLDQMMQVATISGASEQIGSIVATTVHKAGKSGVVSVQDGVTSDIKVEYKEGLEFDQGFISPALITDEERAEASYAADTSSDKSQLYVAIVNSKLTAAQLVKIISTIGSTDATASVLFICDDYDDAAANSIIVNKLRKGFKLLAVKSPEYGEHRLNLLQDLAAVTGGKVLGGPTGVPVEQVTLADLGRCERVLSTVTTTTITGGKASREAKDERIKAIRHLLSKAKTPAESDKLESRLARLTGGVAVILVGAASPAEQREIKERVIDAVNATKAAIEEGIVPGGGVALITAAESLSQIKVGEAQVGVSIMRKAIEYPLRKLADNAGQVDAGYVVEIVKSDDSGRNKGYNVETGQFEDMLESGIIDPVKVTRLALENATSTASILMTTDMSIVYQRTTQPPTNEDTLGLPV